MWRKFWGSPSTSSADLNRSNLPVTTSRDILLDIKGTLGDKFDPDMDYCLCNQNDRSGTTARKFAEGYEMIQGDIAGSGTENMVLLGKKR